MNDHTQFRPFDNIGGDQLGGDLNGVSELMTRPNTSIGILIIDESGSMQQHGDAPPKAVDKAVDTLKIIADGRTYYIGIVGFSDIMRVLQQIKPVDKITALQGYRANGNTRLFATVLDVLTFLLGQLVRAADRVAPDLSIAVGVFSDGADNLSQSAQGLLHETVASVRPRGWALQTFGIGIDSKRLAQLLGFDPDIAITVKPNAEGLDSATTSFVNTMSTIWRKPDPSSGSDIRSDP